MRILTRYILREVVAHAAIGVGLFTFVLFMRDIAKLMEVVVRNSAPLPTVVEAFLYTLPPVLKYTVPMGVLVGILIGLGRLAADSEVTAMRASGLGVGLFVRAMALFAIAAWLFSLLVSVWLAPWSSKALAELQNRLSTSQASYEVQPRVFYEDFENYVLYVQDVSAAGGAAIWRGIVLADIRTAGAPKIILAEEGVVINESPARIRLHLKNGSQHESNPRQPAQYSITSFSETDIPIDLPEAEPRQTVMWGPVQELASGRLWELSRTAEPDAARWLAIEFQRRLALPSSCLVLALVGIPLGLSSKKGGKSTGFILTIFLVFVYYSLTSVGVGLARQAKLTPVLGAWMANILFLLGGLVLLWRVDRLEIGGWRFAHAGWRQRLMKRAEGAASAFERAANRRRMFSGRFPQILDDYILRDFTTYLLLILAAFLVLALVFTFFDLLGDIVRNKVPLITVGEYLVNFLPSMVYLMAPMAVLLAVLVTFGILHKSNEITAMKATGISIYRAVLPVLVLASVLPVGLFFFEQFYLPQANKRQDAIRNAIKGKPAQTYLRPDRKWIFGQQSTIYYYEFFDPNADIFGSISAFEFDPKSFQFTRRVYARGAHWDDHLQKWVFERGWEREFRGNAIAQYRTFDVSTFAELNEPPVYFKKEVKQSSEMNYVELKRYIDDLQQSGFDVVRLRVQLHKKFAYPLITFVMAVLAIPFAVGASKRGAIAGVATAVGIAIVYIVVSGLFEALGNLNQLPPALAAWSPDLIFGLAGGYLILKVST